MSTKTAKIDAVNIGLMLLSLLPAMLLPFELFLFVYAFLGPLHYLTEINWLHKKNYFTTQKYDYLLMVGVTVIICLLVFFKSEYKYYTPILYLAVTAAAFSMVTYSNYTKKVFFTIAVLLVGSLFFYFFHDGFKMLFTTLLPTIIHVFIFTAAFILLGSLKSKSKLGMLSILVFMACAGITLFVSPYTILTHVDEIIYNYYKSFRNMNAVLLHFFSFMQTEDARIAIWAPSGLNENDMAVYFSGAGIRIMRFIAFAYTYHYLNWFSKTSIIQWHNTKKINLVIIAVVWIASVVLYSIDYIMGLKWLFALSLAHVLLELPLNQKSFIEIRQQLASKFSRQ
jgi:hypothetical protein